MAQDFSDDAESVSGLRKLTLDWNCEGGVVWKKKGVVFGFSGTVRFGARRVGSARITRVPEQQEGFR